MIVAEENIKELKDDVKELRDWIKWTTATAFLTLLAALGALIAPFFIRGH